MAKSQSQELTWSTIFATGEDLPDYLEVEMPKNPRRITTEKATQLLDEGVQCVMQMEAGALTTQVIPRKSDEGEE